MCNESHQWAIHHAKHGCVSYNAVAVVITDPIKVRSVWGKAIFDTRGTARMVIEKLENMGVSMDGYTARIVERVVRVA